VRLTRWESAACQREDFAGPPTTHRTPGPAGFSLSLGGALLRSLALRIGGDLAGYAGYPVELPNFRHFTCCPER
jgi:hypothetical protein